MSDPSYTWLCLTLANWRIEDTDEDLYAYIGRKFIADHGFGEKPQVKEARKYNNQKAIARMIGDVDFTKYPPSDGGC